jgi:hypothetical protein
MKVIITTLFITNSIFSDSALACSITPKDLNFVTPNRNGITNTFWQDEKQEDETVKRLYITYKDGSTAIIKHRFCSTYQFEAAYYMEEKDRVTSTKKIKTSLTKFLSYVAHKDSTKKEAIRHMIAELDKYSFAPDEIAGVTYNGHDPAYGDTSYSITYFPINYSSLHGSAIFVGMRIGGMH